MVWLGFWDLIWNYLQIRFGKLEASGVEPLLHMLISLPQIGWLIWPRLHFLVRRIRSGPSELACLRYRSAEAELSSSSLFSWHLFGVCICVRSSVCRRADVCGCNHAEPALLKGLGRALIKIKLGFNWEGNTAVLIRSWLLKLASFDYFNGKPPWVRSSEWLFGNVCSEILWNTRKYTEIHVQLLLIYCKTSTAGL